MVEEMSLGVKAPGESKVEHPCREKGGEGRGGGMRHWAPYEMKVSILFFKIQLMLGKGLNGALGG